MNEQTDTKCSSCHGDGEYEVSAGSHSFFTKCKSCFDSGIKNKTNIPINDERLTSKHKRTRSGSTMIFYTKLDESDRFKIVAPRPELVAEIDSDGDWFWRNDCPSCNGKGRRFAYVECEKHNVCKECGIPRRDINDSVWGTSDGWCCNSCMEILEAQTRKEAFDQLNGEEPETHYMDEIICPHCGSEIGSDDVGVDQDMQCGVCKGEMKVTLNFTIDYTTMAIGERLLK